MGKSAGKWGENDEQWWNMTGWWFGTWILFFHMSYSQNLRQWKVVFEASLFFGNWAEAWKTIIHSSKTITCAYVDLGHQSSCVLRRKLFNVFRMREANGKTFFYQ
jgi:hypothetical protein